jgi:hypothetical protein
MKMIGVLMGVFTLALAPQVQAQTKGSRMYKCIDAAGKAYYSDKMNPDCNQSSELNQQGVVIPKKKEPAKPGQPKADPALPPSKAEKEQERRDRALMATYTSEDEIDEARDRSLELPAQATRATEAKLETANTQLADLKKQADDLAGQKKKLPPALLEDVSARQKQVARYEAELAQRKVQADAIRAKYESDKQRFRELKGAATTSR